MLAALLHCLEPDNVRMTKTTPLRIGTRSGMRAAFSHLPPLPPTAATLAFRRDKLHKPEPDAWLQQNGRAFLEEYNCLEAVRDGRRQLLTTGKGGFDSITGLVIIATVMKRKPSKNYDFIDALEITATVSAHSVKVVMLPKSAAKMTAAKFVKSISAAFDNSMTGPLPEPVIAPWAVGLDDSYDKAVAKLRAEFPPEYTYA